MTEGVFRAFVIFDKPDPLVGPFFEETIYVTPSRASQAVQQAIVDQVAAAARALGLRHGPDSRRVPREYAGRLRARSRAASDWWSVRSSRAIRTQTDSQSRSRRCCFDTRWVKTSRRVDAIERGLGRDDDSDSEAGCVPRCAAA